jgi:hypothetical protein
MMRLGNVGAPLHEARTRLIKRIQFRVRGKRSFVIVY